MGCYAFIKVVMFIFNGTIFLAGCGLLGVGIWVKVDSGSIFNFLGKLDNVPPELGQVLNVGYLLIAVGMLLLLVGFLGCCGAIKESKCMLLMFFIIVLVIFLAEVAGAVVILVFRPLVDDLMSKVGEAAVKSIKEDYGKNEDITGLWSTTMTTLKCCGFNGASDFENSPYYNDNNNELPPECCPGLEDPCNLTPADSDEAIGGCFPKIKDLINGNTVAIVGVALGIAALEICAMTVSMLLYCRLKATRA